MDKEYALVRHTCTKSFYLPYTEGHENDIFANPIFCPVCEVKFFPIVIIGIFKADVDSMEIAKYNMSRF